ncbi:MAG: ATP synthase F1 subunit epsilon [Clostridium sp.]|uniref:ATP synthase F1 subunit epsilon n=1 Tax=Clostridium sp. TaxID=1506 RepID=UPI003031A02B
MNKTFNLIIITPENEVFKGDVVNLNCETTEGRMGILPDHCAVIAGLVPTITKFEEESGEIHEVKTSDGILKVRKNKVSILCNTAEWVK